ncbi:MAG: FAD-dependent oxidoreductase [Bilophila wadsworthia]
MPPWPTKAKCSTTATSTSTRSACRSHGRRVGKSSKPGSRSCAPSAYGKVNKPRKGEDYRVRQQRIYDFMADKTFSEFTGPLSEEADAFFRPTVSRSSGDPEEISAGAGVGYFLLVWDKSSGLARNIVGGAATLPQAIAHTLGDKVKLGAEVLEVIQHRDHVEVTYKSDAQGSDRTGPVCRDHHARGNHPPHHQKPRSPSTTPLARSSMGITSRGPS